MKKLFTLLLAWLAWLPVLHAKPIDEQTARTAGMHFLASRTNSAQLRGVTQLNLTYHAAEAAGPASAASPAYFYVFNSVGPQGFVIVAADDEVLPVLGYSDQVSFDPGNIAPQVAKWLEGYCGEIRRIRALHLPAPAEVTAEWQALLNPNTAARPSGGAAVAPLVQTHWDQSPNYNALCPFDNSKGQRTVTGCVATAMAQVMKFWNYPATGSGFHSFNHATYGTLSANFGTTTFQWSGMPNTVSSANAAVATLMYQAGVSVDMNYGVASTGGSGAYVVSSASPVTHCTEYALKNYFGYKSTLRGVLRSAYTQAQWLALLKTEFDAGRPVVYAGFGGGGGHCFVADGYDNNDFVHFNWGWSGQYDGYFSINALNPGGVGTGGGTGGYNNNHQAVIGIEPPAGSSPGTPTYTMGLYNFVTPSAASIGYGQSFSITTNIVNTGTATFSGDYCAAAFDNNGNFVDFVATKTAQSLQGGYAYSNNLVFSTTGLLSMLPGTYRVGIFYRPTGGNWILVANRNSYTNLVTMNVVNPSAIEMNAAMVLTPSAAFIRGQAASVSLNIRNAGIGTFVGQYQLNLYNLDGTFVQTINTLNENTGLPVNYTYQTPGLTFTTTSITANPGTYLMALVYKPNTSSSWILGGSTYYQNPIQVTVQAAALAADPYEVNDAVAQASALALTFAGSTATRATTGSNCHVGSDYDFYKITLPAGYGYTLSTRLHDSYNSGNGNTYTLDALFSYSTDGVNWSPTYDDVMPGPIVVNGGVTVYFRVAPYFTGNVGTYLLNIDASRGPTATRNPQLAGLIGLFPNPARGTATLDFGRFEGQVTGWQLLNVQGQVVQERTTPPAGPTEHLPVANLADGVYLVRLETNQGVVIKKLIVQQ